MSPRTSDVQKLKMTVAKITTHKVLFAVIAFIAMSLLAYPLWSTLAGGAERNLHRGLDRRV